MLKFSLHDNLVIFCDTWTIYLDNDTFKILNTFLFLGHAHECRINFQFLFDNFCTCFFTYRGFYCWRCQRCALIIPLYRHWGSAGIIYYLSHGHPETRFSRTRQRVYASLDYLRTEPCTACYFYVWRNCVSRGIVRKLIYQNLYHCYMKCIYLICN